MIRRWFPKLGVWARLLVGGVGLVTLCALSIAVLWIWHGWQVDAELDRLRAAGEPVTLVDLKRVYPPPPSELDATPHWLSGFEAQKLAPSDPAYRALPLVGERGHGQIDALLPGQPWPEFVLAERYVDERSEVLRHFRAAAKVGGAVAKITAAAHVGRYVDEHDQVVNLDIKLELKPFVYASNVVRLAFLVELRRGRTAQALDALRSYFVIDHAFESVNQIKSGPLGYVYDDPHWGALMLASSLNPSDGELAELQTLVRRIDNGRRLRQSLARLRVLGLWLFENGGVDAIFELSKYDAHRAAETISPIGVSGPVDLHAFLDNMAEFVAASKLPWPQALRKADLLEAQRRRSMALFQPYAMIAAHSTHEEFFATATAEALNRATDAALGVARYRLKHGKTPTELGLMVPMFLPEVPKDPFTGEPLRYRVEKDGFVVYSVGKDGVDDGGPRELYDPVEDPGVRMRDETTLVREGTQTP